MSEIQYISYLRVSRKEQGRSGLGVEAQRYNIAYFAKIDGAVIVKEYIEIEGGGEMDNRPILKEAIKHSSQSKLPIIVAKLDRISRSVPDIHTILDQLQDRLISCDIPSKPLDKFMVTLYTAFSERELMMIRLRTRQALAAKKARGEKMGTPRNLTAKAKQKGSQVAQQRATDFKQDRILISVIRSCIAEKMDNAKIASELNRLNFTTYRGKKFNALSVYRLIQSTIKKTNEQS